MGVNRISAGSLIGRLVALLSVGCIILCRASDDTAPSLAPTSNIHPIPPYLRPDPDDSGNSTNTTIAPTVSPHDHNITEAPFSPNVTSVAPSLAPHHDHRNHSNVTTLAPSLAPATPGTSAPTPVLPPVEPPENGFSLLRILAKTIAWCIIIALSVLLFGAIMSHRYRILYFCRGLYVVLLRMECTQWILHKLSAGYEWLQDRVIPARWRTNGGTGAGARGSLSNILFQGHEDDDDVGRYYNEMREGLLRGDND